ncbi:MAG: hypothetical protein AAGF96_18725 [Bacteroidota bacterium]
MDMIKVITKIEKELPVAVDVSDFVHALNELPIQSRINYIAKILNGVQLYEYNALNKDQLELVKGYFLSRLHEVEQVIKRK